MGGELGLKSGKRKAKTGRRDWGRVYCVHATKFKIGAMLRQAREAAGVTQEGLARITKTKKSAISRPENHAEDVRLSTVARVARALGKAVRIELVKAS
jgi:ribosome-binding protein aMBF1 (putative translation factor)